MHRGRKYRIQSMESPPPFVGGASFGPSGCTDLLAFSKPTSLQYSTQALSINQITVVKQIGHAEVTHSASKSSSTAAIAGHGIVTVKRTVHGYKKVCRVCKMHGHNILINFANNVTSSAAHTIKLSHVNRKELSRSTISLPPMEFDTYALWIDADASYLRDVVLFFDAGVHALVRSIVACSQVQCVLHTS